MRSQFVSGRGGSRPTSGGSVGPTAVSSSSIGGGAPSPTAAAAASSSAFLFGSVGASSSTSGPKVSPPSSPALGAGGTVQHINEVEQRLGIVKRNRAGSSSSSGGGGAGVGSPSHSHVGDGVHRNGGDGHAQTPPCDVFPAFDLTTPLSATSVQIVKQLTAEMIDSLFFPEASGGAV